MLIFLIIVSTTKGSHHSKFKLRTLQKVERSKKFLIETYIFIRYIDNGALIIIDN